MAHTFFTIGHSTLAVADFVSPLNNAGVHLVVDVRMIPRSRANPQYNGDALCEALTTFRVDYVHLPALGGLRGRAFDIAGSVNAFWTNQRFHNYADYAMTQDFRIGLAELRERGHARICAVMCAEAVWWRCHRRIIADYLIAAGEMVLHILPGGRISPAQLTPAATAGPGNTLIYPAGPVRAKTDSAACSCTTSSATRPTVRSLKV
jgi:uncharacterized protein (DUF488 family)